MCNGNCVSECGETTEYEFETMPVGYYDECVEQGTVQKIEYSTEAYSAELLKQLPFGSLTSSKYLNVYLPISKENANLFFQLIDRRYEKFSTIITTNINFSSWDEVFCDPVIANAILDRLLHHAKVITVKGKSFRLKHLDTDSPNH